MKNVEMIRFAAPDDLARAVATAWLAEIDSARKSGKLHSVALSGGRITQKFFTATVELARAQNISLSHVHFFWADERCVPPNDPESNFKLANELLFRPLNISETQIHRIHGEDSPEQATQIAIEEFNRIIPGQIFDLIFLGMGEDGHVASLFPGASAEILDTSVPFLVVKNSPKPPPTRISLSYKMLFTATNVWVLASGTGKESALRESVSASGATPLGRVLQHRVATKIFSDVKEF